jgi:hypothetical protein
MNTSNGTEAIASEAKNKYNATVPIPVAFIDDRADTVIGCIYFFICVIG